MHTYDHTLCVLSVYKYCLYTFIIILFLPCLTPSTDKPVTDVCLGCICEAISGCNQTRFCGSGVCGLFRITWAYWADGGKLTLGNDSPQSEEGKCNQTDLPALPQLMSASSSFLKHSQTAWTIPTVRPTPSRITWSSSDRIAMETAASIVTIMRPFTSWAAMAARANWAISTRVRWTSAWPPSRLWMCAHRASFMIYYTHLYIPYIHMYMYILYIYHNYLCAVFSWIFYGIVWIVCCEIFIIKWKTFINISWGFAR